MGAAAALFRRLALLGALCAALAACSPPVKDTGYLDSYQNFDLANKRSVKIRSTEALRQFTAPATAPSAETTPSLLAAAAPSPTPGAAPAASAGATSSTPAPAEPPYIFVVLPTRWEAVTKLGQKERDDLQRLARDRIYTWIGRGYPPPTFIRFELLPGDPLLKKGRVVFVESCVTELKSGIGILRYLIGFGLGEVEMQIEGRLREKSPAGPVLAEYAIRVSHNGYPRMGINVKSLSDSYCFKHAANTCAYELVKYARKALQPPPPPPGWKAMKFD